MAEANDQPYPLTWTEEAIARAIAEERERIIGVFLEGTCGPDCNCSACCWVHHRAAAIRRGEGGSGA